MPSELFDPFALLVVIAFAIGCVAIGYQLGRKVGK